MVKVNIRDYEAPMTHRTLVELEEGVCDASMFNNHEKNQIAVESEKINTGFDHNQHNYATTDWEETYE